MTIEQSLGLIPITIFKKKSKEIDNIPQAPQPVTRQAPKEGTYVPPPYPTEAAPPIQPDS